MSDDTKVIIFNGDKPHEEVVLLREKEDKEKSEFSPVNFEEAILLTGHGKFYYILQLGCGLCLISMISEILNTAYLLPSAECDFHMSSRDKGMLSAVCYLGMITSSHLWGFIADTKGRKRTLVWTLVLDGFCALASSFSHSYWLFLIFRFFNGFFICGPSAVVYAYMGEFHSDATRSRAIMWGAVFLSGAIIGLPGVAWVIISQPWSLELPLYTYHSWRVFVVVCGLPSFLTAALFLVWLPESPKFLLAHDREQEALDVLRYMFAVNTGRDSQDYKVKSLAREVQSEGQRSLVGARNNHRSPAGIFRLMWAQTKPLFRSPHLTNTLLGCSLMFGIFASFNGLLLWLPEIFNRLAEYSDLYPGVSASVCEVISALASNSTSTLAEKFPLSNLTDIYSPNNVTRISGSMVKDYIPSNVTSYALNETVSTCATAVAPAVFTKSLVIGGSSAVANIACGFLIGHVGKKNLLVTCLIVSGLSGLALLLARSATGVLVLSSILEGLTLTSPTVLNSIIVDIFPTHLRAMAVCVSMLMGRVGTVTSSIVLGLLLEVNCLLVFLALSGVLLVCGSLGCLLPSPWLWRVR